MMAGDRGVRGLQPGRFAFIAAPDMSESRRLVSNFPNSFNASRTPFVR